MNELVAQEILNHQLNGIMLHSDMLDLFTFLDLNKLACIQERQLIEEIKTHIRTKRTVFNNTGKLLHAKPDTRQDLSVPTIETQEEKLSLAKQAIQKWRTWEYQTLTVYINACEKESECKLWCELKRTVEKEICNIDKMLGNM